MSRGKLLVAVLGGLLGLFSAMLEPLSAGLPAAVTERPAAEDPAQSACRAVDAQQDLQAAIESAAEGDRLCLSPGTFRGAFLINKSLTISGPRDAVIRNPDRGSTIFINADNVTLEGFTIAGSGQNYVAQDAGVFISESDHINIRNIVIEDVLFGITSQQVNDLTIENSSVVCRAKRALGMRGDGIRLWETRQSLIAGNELRHCRDMVVWYSPENVIRDNRVSHGRYGTHFMYSSRNVIRGNHYVGNVVGVFVMYSRNLLIEDNVFADAAGAAGMGLGLKESGNLEVVNNRFVHNSVGIYLDNSPLYQGDRNLFAHNELQLGDIGITFHSSPHQNEFVANTLKDNLRLISIEGGGDALGVEWSRNYYDFYEGYDFDGDGVGDVPFELRSVVDALINRYPQLKLFTGSLAMFLLETSSRLVPMYQPELLMKDDRPLMMQAAHSAAAPQVEAILAERGIFAVAGDAGVLNAEQAELGGEEQHAKY